MHVQAYKAAAHIGRGGADSDSEPDAPGLSLDASLDC